MACRICAAAVAPYLEKNGYTVFRCPRCGFGQVDVSPAMLADFYDQSYFKGDKADFDQEEHGGFRPAYKIWIEEQLKPLWGRPALRVLELGPGLGGPMAGYLTREHKDVAYTGIEFSEYATERLQARGLDVHHGRVVDAEYAEKFRGAFDLVFATEVIEHDLEPIKFLESVHAMLKPGGRAAFTTGNLDGLMARTQKAKWYYMDPPAHVSFFTPRSARRAFMATGFVEPHVTRWGFRHIEVADGLPLGAAGKRALLWLTDVANISTGMTISAKKV